ncbi:MAG: site-specific DNA-methyltransferase [Phycisphaerales bacterium]
MSHPPRRPRPSTRVVHADCLRVLARLPAACADLVYLDPPFNTGRAQRARRGTSATYDDAWSDSAAYLAFLRPRLAECHRVLKPTGSILLHCDWRHSHHLRLLLDDLFGSERFVNHLVWSYGLGGSSPRGFARKHDDILFYARGPRHWFEPPRVPATSVRLAGRTKKATDVIDIPAINNMARERTGYPTQKPLELLRLLVGACCPPDGLVIDPFCGSGTTLVAAAELGRRALGIDQGAEAVSVARRRLAKPALFQ